MMYRVVVLSIEGGIRNVASEVSCVADWLRVGSWDLGSLFGFLSHNLLNIL